MTNVTFKIAVGVPVLYKGEPTPLMKPVEVDSIDELNGLLGQMKKGYRLLLGNYDHGEVEVRWEYLGDDIWKLYSVNVDNGEHEVIPKVTIIRKTSDTIGLSFLIYIVVKEGIKKPFQRHEWGKIGKVAEKIVNSILKKEVTK